MSFNVRLDVSDLDAGIEHLRRHYPAGIARALNRSGISARVALTQVISKDMGIKSTDVKKEIVITEAAPGQEKVTLTARGKRIPLIAFRARGPEPSRGRGKGVTYRLPSGRGRHPNAFIATVGKGRHRGVFVRGYAGRPAGRLPIRELFGPSLPKVFAAKSPVGLDRGMAALVKNMQSETRFALRR